MSPEKITSSPNLFQQRHNEIKTCFNRYLSGETFEKEIDRAEDLDSMEIYITSAIQDANKELNPTSEDVGAAMEELKLTERDSFTSKKLLYEYLVNNAIDRGFMFHAFNGAFEESISQYGLDPDTRLFNQDELDTIDSNSDKIGLLGWHKSSADSVYLLGVTGNTLDSPVYSYAVSSPEWFSQLCQGGSRLYTDNRFDNTAFQRRDHDASLANIKTFISVNKDRVSPDVERATLDLFEKYWEVFAGPDSRPKLAIINGAAIKEDLPPISYQTLVDYGGDKTYNGQECSIEDMVKSTVDRMLSNDNLAIRHTIAPEDIIIVDLPDYQ